MSRARNPAVVLLTALLLLSSACTRRYFVNPAHVARAQASPDARLPALTNEREPTFILASAIRRQELVDGGGLLAVRARDSRNFLRVTGWIATAIGALYGSFALAFLPNDDPDSVERQLGIVFGGVSLFHLAVGVPFLVLGYMSTGAEEERPSPGMPQRVGDP